MKSKLIVLLILFCSTLNAFGQPKAGKCKKGDCINGYGVYVYGYNDGDRLGDKYEGEWVNGLNSGKGKYYWINGDTYDGDWVNGIMSGKGKFVWANGSSYEGDFVNGKQTGAGTYINEYEVSYVGFFDCGHYIGKTKPGCLSGNCIDGTGSILYEDGSTYEGEFKNGKPNGKGVLAWPAYSYTGEFKDGIPDGIGSETWADGRVFTGNYVNGFLRGKTVKIDSDGSRYEGYWGDHGMEGYGEYHSADSSVSYKGQWAYSLYNGQGTLTYPTYSYTGSFVDGKYEGQGVLTGNDGSVQTGNFSKNLAEGYGVRINKDGTREEGTWRYGDLITKNNNTETDNAANKPTEVIKTEEFPLETSYEVVQGINSNRDPSPYSLQIEIVHRKVKTSVSWLTTTEIVSINAIAFKVTGSAGSWQDIIKAPAYLLEEKYSYNDKTYIFETQLNGIDIWFELFGYGEY